MEDPPPYLGAAADPEPSPLTTEDQVALAHAHHYSVPYETGEQWLARLPERLRALADLILGGKTQGGDVAHTVAARIDSVEHAPDEASRCWR